MSFRINTEIIRSLSPCESRFDNYLKHYKNFDGTLEDFLGLENITYNDKVWVFNKLANRTQLLKWSYLCAESVLYIFEDKYPNDKRPRQALDALLNYINEQTEEHLRLCKYAAKAAYAADAAANAAYAAANAAYAAYAAANADAAADAAAYAAYVAAYAAAKAANAANTDGAADAAAYAAANAANTDGARESQQDLNLLFMVEVVSYKQKTSGVI